MGSTSQSGSIPILIALGVASMATIGGVSVQILSDTAEKRSLRSNGERLASQADVVGLTVATKLIQGQTVNYDSNTQSWVGPATSHPSWSFSDANSDASLQSNDHSPGSPSQVVVNGTTGVPRMIIRSCDPQKINATEVFAVNGQIPSANNCSVITSAVNIESRTSDAKVNLRVYSEVSFRAGFETLVANHSQRARIAMVPNPTCTLAAVATNVSATRFNLTLSLPGGSDPSTVSAKVEGIDVTPGTSISYDLPSGGGTHVHSFLGEVTNLAYGTKGFCNNAQTVDLNSTAGWTWFSGEKGNYETAVTGTMGVADPLNRPGGRHSPCMWVDAFDNIWIWGGYGFGPGLNTRGHLNDLWKFDGTNWTWIRGGENALALRGNYGTKGTTASTNWPPARGYTSCWKDSSGNVWFYGGNGYDSAGAIGNSSDLWKWDGTNWTWVAGPKAITENPVHGTLGVPGSAMTPGSRDGSVGWADSTGKIWISAGWRGSKQNFADIWRWDGANWAWMAGKIGGFSPFGGYTSSGWIYSQPGVYGTRGVAAATNVMGSRFFPTAWKDNSGNVFFFGGYGCDSVACNTDNTSGSAHQYPGLNDLWKWDGTNFTWISGATTAGQLPNYPAAPGTTGAGYYPGARYKSGFTADSDGKGWIFGGTSWGTDGKLGVMNDFWVNDGTDWLWLGGGTTGDQLGNFGVKGVAAPNNTPSARMLSGMVQDSKGQFWLFGGNGCDAYVCDGSINDTTGGKMLNDLWRYVR